MAEGARVDTVDREVYGEEDYTNQGHADVGYGEDSNQVVTNLLAEFFGGLKRGGKGE